MTFTNEPPKIYNRPGLPALAYRIGDWASFRRRLLTNLPKYAIGSANIAPLAQLTTRANDDPAIAILDAWAVVADVLTFYQERIANEGFIATGTEIRSILELARAIGYELDPGVAASTFLAFTVDDAASSSGLVTVPVGTQIVSIPSEDELPQTFETSAEIIARAEWNGLKPRPTKPQEINSNTQKIYLQGINTRLQAGDRILLIDHIPQEDVWYLLTLATVEIIPGTGYTQITWNQQLPSPIPNTLRNPQIFAFRQRAALFGYNAPKWQDMPNEIKRSYQGTIKGGIFRSSNNDGNWTPTNTGLPTIDIRCLAVDQTNDYLFAGTSGAGIFRSTDNGDTWKAINVGLTNLHIQTFYIDDRGYILAGTPGGGVFSSKDHGENWTPINLGTVGVEYTGVNNTNVNTINTALPNTVIRSLVSYTTTNNSPLVITAASNNGTVTVSETNFTTNIAEGDTITAADQTRTINKINSNISLTINAPFDPNLPDNTTFLITRNSLNPLNSQNYIFAGTDDGIYRTSDQGKNWKIKGLLGKAVLSLVTYQNQGIYYLFAGTDDGIYCSNNHGETWNRKNLDNNQIIRSLITEKIQDSQYIMAGTQNDILVSVNHGNDWVKINLNKNVTSLAYNVENRYLFAGGKHGILRYQKNQNTNDWHSVDIIDTGLNNPNINTIISTGNQIFVGTSFAGFVEDAQQEWPNFQIQPQQGNQNQQLNLDNIYSQILPESWIVLLTEDGQTAKPCQVVSSSNITLRDFGLDNKITRILLKNNLNPSDFGLRKTLVLAQSEVLKLASETLSIEVQQQKIFSDPIRENEIYLSAYISGLQPGKTVIVSGKRIRIKIENIGGVFQLGETWKRVNSGLTNTVVRTLSISENGKLFLAGTEGGVFQSEDNGNNWKSMNEGLKNKDVQALVVSNDDRIFVGTNDGVFYGHKFDSKWQRISTDLENINVLSLAVNAVGDVFVGTQKGAILVIAANTDNLILKTLINQAIQVMAINEDGTIFAGTPNNLYCSQTGNNWQEILQNVNVTAIAFHSDGTILIGTADNGVLRLLPGTWLKFATYLTSMKIRCLSVNQGHICAGTAMNGVLQSKDNGETWTQNTGLKNIDIQAIAFDERNIYAGGVGILTSTDGFSAVDLKIGDQLQLISPPKSQIWNLRDRNGVAGFVEVIAPDDISLQPAAIDDEVVSEVGVIKTPPDDQLLPILTLTQPLQNSYDPATVVIYANVTPATHGETIEEVLGSGDGTLANQRFILKKPPLTYIPATTPNGAKTTLELFVDGVRWQEVPSLYGLNHLDQNYITRIGDDGTTTITFGDGEKGARLPSGLENVIARYRSGIGLAGEVAQDSLSLLKTRPLGIREVTNPVSATGAAAREALNEARVSAPLTVRSLDRIVSLQDFEDFSRAFAGIGKAKAEVLANEAMPIVYITVAAVNGKAVTPDSQLYTNLVQAISESRAPEQLDVQVSSYQPLLFNLEAKILVDSRYEVKSVLAQVHTALQETFAFEKRAFGQSVTTSEAIAAIQHITGVVAVDLDALYLLGFAKTLESSLSAATARWDAQQNNILPAQLLLLNPNGITLINNL